MDAAGNERLLLQRYARMRVWQLLWNELCRYGRPAMRLLERYRLSLLLVLPDVLPRRQPRLLQLLRLLALQGHGLPSRHNRLHLCRPRSDGSVLMEIVMFLRVTVAMIFLIALLAKLRDVSGFADAIQRQGLARSRRLSLPLASGVLAGEAAIGGLLLTGRWTGIASVMASVLLISFSAVTVRNITRQRHVDCGCLGDRVGVQMGWSSVALNIGLALGLVASIGVSRDPLGLEEIVVVHMSSLLLAANYWLIAYARAVSEVVNEALRASPVLELRR